VRRDDHKHPRHRGYTSPEVFASIIDDVFNRVPNIDKAIISVHCHNDLGMATANSVTAVAHGARQWNALSTAWGARRKRCPGRGRDGA